MARPRGRPRPHDGAPASRGREGGALGSGRGRRRAAPQARCPAVRGTERTLRRREALERWITRSCGSGYHPCGTAPMGPEGDVSAAVDGRGRVRGVEGLVVADVSIMPTIPSVNTNLTALMIGEWLRDGAV
ncbi:GMC family oxidoreductase [Sorangium sp. So ce693]|uniref:GMC family oxidoreductase n=1 Tax=Sorangium sp. So ce693 TaxID=3133318 RepID=UPI003F5DF058